jgi:hypothetical protein
MSVHQLLAPNTLDLFCRSITTGAGGTGIETLSSPDANLAVAVVGTVGQISLAANPIVANDLTVSNDLIVLKNADIKSQVKINGNPGTAGQVLTSGGAGVASWAAVPLATPTQNLVGIGATSFVSSAAAVLFDTITPSAGFKLFTLTLTVISATNVANYEVYIKYNSVDVVKLEQQSVAGTGTTIHMTQTIGILCDGVASIELYGAFISFGATVIDVVVDARESFIQVINL